MHLRCMTFREHPPIRIASGDGGCCIMHLRCMTFKASAGHDRNIFPQMPFFLSDLFTVCDKAVSVRFKVITRIIHAHLGYRSAHRIEDDRIELIVSHDQYCISII